MIRQCSVFCIARDGLKAVRILDDLKASGTPSETVSVLLPENAVVGGFGPATAAERQGMTGPAHGRGGLLGGSLRDLEHMCILNWPGLCRVVGAGPLMASLTAVAPPSGFVASIELLIRAGLSEPQAQGCEACLRAGKVFFSIQCETPGESKRIEWLVQQAGAQDTGHYSDPAGGCCEPMEHQHA
jgi:hypothetical protein